MDKQLKPKPIFYANCFAKLQQIAKDMGYNLLLHGSMSRDFDLVAIPWTDNPREHMELIHAFCDYLGVKKSDDKAYYLYSVLLANREAYVINLNRNSLANADGGVVDAQYYLDISFTPFFPIETQTAIDKIDREIAVHTSILRKANIMIQMTGKNVYWERKVGQKKRGVAYFVYTWRNASNKIGELCRCRKILTKP